MFRVCKACATATTIMHSHVSLYFPTLLHSLHSFSRQGKASSLQSLQLFSLPLMCVLLCTVLQEHCSAQLDQLKAARFAHKHPLLSWVQGQWGEKSRCRTRSQRIAKYMDKNVICFIHADFVPIIHYVFKLLALCWCTLMYWTRLMLT